MTKKQRMDKIINEIESEIEELHIPIFQKLTFFQRVQNAMYECEKIGRESRKAKVKMGHWIDTNGEEEYFGEEYECSLCGGRDIGESNYCSYCGAKMKKGKKE